MTKIVTRPLSPGHIGAEIHEGNLITHHEVVVDPNLLDDMALFETDHQLVAKETVAFLLERHTSAELPDRISMRDVDRMEPDYRDELTTRLASR
jgi:hypothetical protein